MSEYDFIAHPEKPNQVWQPSMQDIMGLVSAPTQILANRIAVENALAQQNIDIGKMNAFLTPQQKQLPPAQQQQAQLNALQAEGQGYSQWYQPLSAVAGLGQAQASGNQQVGAQTAQSMGNNIVGAGNALAAGQVGAANAWSTGLSNMGSSLNSGLMNYLMYSGLNSGVGGGAIDYTGMGSMNYNPAAALY